MKKAIFLTAAIIVAFSGCSNKTADDKPVAVESVEKDISQLDRVTLEEVYAGTLESENADITEVTTSDEKEDSGEAADQKEDNAETAGKTAADETKPISDTEKSDDVGGSEKNDGSYLDKAISGISGLIQKARMLIPWDYGIFESMGFDVTNDKENKTVTIKDDEYTIIIEYYADYIIINGEKIELEVPQQYIDGVIYIPLRAVAESVGAEVIWHPSTKTATVSYKDKVIQVTDYDVPEKVQTVQNYIDTVNTFDNNRDDSYYCVRDLDEDGTYELIVFDDEKMLVCSYKDGELCDYNGAVESESIKSANCYKSSGYEGLRTELPSGENKEYAVGGVFAPVENGVIFGVGSDGRVKHTHFPDYMYYGIEEVENWTDIVAVDATQNFAAGLKNDGTVVVTSRDGSGGDHSLIEREKAAIENWTDIVSIAVANNYIAGLRKNGTVVIQSYCPWEFDFTSSIDWENIIAISMAENHIIGLRSDGTVLNMELAVDGVNLPTNCADAQKWTDIKAIGCSSSFNVGLRSDGTVVATDYYYTEMAVGDKEYFEECKKIMAEKRKELASWTDITAISVSNDMIAGITRDRKVKIILYSPYYTDPEYGLENNSDYKQFLSDVASWSDIAVIKLTPYHNIIAVKKDGTVLCGKQTDHYADIDYDSASGVVNFLDINIFKNTTLKQNRIMMSDYELWMSEWKNAKTVKADKLDFKKLEHEFDQDFVNGRIYIESQNDKSCRTSLYECLFSTRWLGAQRITGKPTGSEFADISSEIFTESYYKVDADKFKNVLKNKFNINYEEINNGAISCERKGQIYLFNNDWTPSVAYYYNIVSYYELSDGTYYICFEELPEYDATEYYNRYMIAELKEVNGIKVWVYHKTSHEPIQFDSSDSRGKKAEFYTRLNALKAYGNSDALLNVSMSEWRSRSYEIYENTDALLNEVYSYLKETMPAEEFEKLMQVQREWVNVKTKKFDPSNYPDELVGGNSGMTEIRWEETAFTYDRIRELIEYIPNN